MQSIYKEGIYHDETVSDTLENCNSPSETVEKMGLALLRARFIERAHHKQRRFFFSFFFSSAIILSSASPAGGRNWSSISVEAFSMS